MWLYSLQPLELMAMIKAPSRAQTDFYREFLMGRGQFSPLEFGIDLTRESLTDQMVEDFGTHYRGQWTIDELLLHPREAAHFCDEVRRKHGYFDLPDDIILRCVMTARKRGQ
jgi:hypothetical protein